MQNYQNYDQIKKINKFDMDQKFSQHSKSYKEVPEMVHDIKIENDYTEVQNVKIEVELESLEERHDNANDTPLFECKKEFPEYADTHHMNSIVEAYPITGLPYKEEFVNIKHEAIPNDPLCNNMPGHIKVGHTSTSEFTQPLETTINKISEIENNGNNSATMGKYDISNLNSLKIKEADVMKNVKYIQKVIIDNHNMFNKKTEIEIFLAPNFEEDLKDIPTVKRKLRRPNVSKERKHKISLTEERSGEFKHIINNVRCNVDMKSINNKFVEHDDSAHNKFTCDISKFTSNEKRCVESHLLQHSVTTDVKNIIKCNLCEYVTNINSNYVKHMRRHASEKLSCPICNYTCRQKTHLDAHIRAHSCRKQYACNLCNYRCDHKQSLVHHIRTHTGEKPFSCDLCSYKCARRQDLLRHVMTHTGERPYACKYCDYKCGHKPDLVCHIKMHTGDKPFACGLCDFKCSVKQRLVLHTKKHFGEKPFSCDLCQFKCTRKSYLVCHMMTHASSKSFSCNVCSYKTNRKQGLVNHVRIHTGEKPFSCNLCTYKSSYRQGLVIHMRTHTGEKPFSCDVCDRKFGQKQSLVAHMRTHTGEKPFSCRLCKFKCCRKSNLITHMRTHTGEKPYSCNICPFKCGQRSNLVRHMEIH